MSGESSSPPPAPCPSGSFWDYGRQQCVQGATYPSQSYPSPQPCPEGMYWDGGRQQCVQPGTEPTPQQGCPPGYYYMWEKNACVPAEGNQGQYPPPGNHSGERPPEGGYYYDPELEACRQKMDSGFREMESFRMDLEAKARSFHDDFARARAEFGRERHTPEEWRAFTEDFMAKGQALFETAEVDMKARMRAALGDDCWTKMRLDEHFNAPVPMPFFGAGPPMMDEGPRFGAMPPPPPPMGGEDRHFQLNGEAEKLRMECERKVWEVIGPPPHEREAFAQWQSTSPQPPSPQMQQKAQEIWRECEKRIRATFEGEFGHPEVDDERDFKERFGSLNMYFDESQGVIIVQGRHLALQGNPESQMMQKFTCQGALFVDQLFVNGLLADFAPKETGEGTALVITDSAGDRVLSLHDNPRCVVNLAATGEIPSITLDLADHLEIGRNEAGDLQIDDGEVRAALLLHGADAELGDGNQITITGKATFLVHNKGAAKSALGGSIYQDAIEDKQIGAEVVIATGDDGLAVDSTPLGDLEVEVESDKPDQIVARIDSEAGDGKTVVLEIERDVFSTDNLEVTVEGVDENGTATDLNAVEASDLDDVLDPLDDGANTVEYWIVQDKNGFHVLVSFAHFSEKKVTIQSAGEASPTKPPLVPGFEIVALLAAVGLALVVMGVRGRRKD